MTYAENGDTITLEMTRDDYHLLLFMLGAGLARSDQEKDPGWFRRRIDFLNRMNAGNPNYTPYAPAAGETE